MSINATVNNETYTDIDTIVVGDKSIVLEQIQEENSEATNPWEGCLDNTESIGYYLNGCEQATSTGKFVGGSTVTVDTGLGSNVKSFVIIDESTSGYPINANDSPNGCYFLMYDVANDKGLSFLLADQSNFLKGYPMSGNTSSTLFPRAKTATFENGVFSYVPMYDNNATYNNFLPNHTYVWYAW